MAVIETCADGMPLERWDDATRTYTAWDQARTENARPYTADEDAAAAARAAAAALAANEAVILQRARKAMQANRDYLALASPTSAQAAGQVRALTQQVNALIRVLLHDFTAAD